MRLRWRTERKRLFRGDLRLRMCMMTILMCCLCSASLITVPVFFTVLYEAVSTGF